MMEPHKNASAPESRDPLLLPDDRPYVEGKHADGTPWRMMKPADPAPPPAPLNPKSVAELREWAERDRCIFLESGNLATRIWGQSTINTLWDGARHLGLTPPLMPFADVGDDAQHVLANIDALLRWLADTLAQPKSDQGGTGKSQRKVKAGNKRSWTQPELDVAIQAEIGKYSEAIASARNGSKGARQTLCKMLGRNVLTKRLGVKAAKMVGNSPVWQRLADEFGMRRKSGRAAMSRPKKVGLAIAEEAAADAAGDATTADVIRRETLALLDEAIGNVKHRDKGKEMQILKALADTKDRLTRGEIDDSKARQIAEYTKIQLQDDNSDNVLGSL